MSVKPECPFRRCPFPYDLHENCYTKLPTKFAQVDEKKFHCTCIALLSPERLPFHSLTAKYIAQHHHATPKDSPRKAVDGSNCSVMSLGKISIIRLKEEVDPETYNK